MLHAYRTATYPDDKPCVSSTDAGKLYLKVTPNGAKRWFWKCCYDNKEKRLSLVSYPAVKLKEARVNRDDARKLLPQGRSVVQRHKIDKAATRVNSGTTYEKGPPRVPRLEAEGMVRCPFISACAAGARPSNTVARVTPIVVFTSTSNGCTA